MVLVPAPYRSWDQNRYSSQAKFLSEAKQVRVSATVSADTSRQLSN